MKRIVAALTFSALLSSTAVAQTQGGEDQALPSGFQTVPVLKSTTSAEGNPFQFPQTGTAEITSVIGTVEPGGRTPRHKHPVPVFVYVLEGDLEVQTEGAEARTYGAGQAFIESTDSWHQAFNRGTSPTKILVVFMGAEGNPTTVTQE